MPVDKKHRWNVVPTPWFEEQLAAAPSTVRARFGVWMRAAADALRDAPMVEDALEELGAIDIPACIAEEPQPYEIHLHFAMSIIVIRIDTEAHELVLEDLVNL